MQSELQDLIVASTYAEVWVGCERADKVWWVECEAMRTLIGGDVRVWYALMGLGEGEVGGEAGVDVDDVRRMIADARTAGAKKPNGTAQGTEGGEGGEGSARPSRSVCGACTAPTSAPPPSQRSTASCATSCPMVSGREKLECIGRIRAVLFACMSNAAMITLRRRREVVEQRRSRVEEEEEEEREEVDGLREGEEVGVEEGDVEVGSVDDYMCLLSFLLLHLNPFGLLSHLSFLRLLHSPAASYKPFVDVLTAVKALFAMQATLAPRLTYPEAVLARAKLGVRGTRSGEGMGRWGRGRGWGCGSSRRGIGAECESA